MAVPVLVTKLTAVPHYPYTTLFATFFSFAVLYLLYFFRPNFPKQAPKLVSDSLPIVGSLNFFTQRWDFFQSAASHSPTGHFSFYAGRYPVIGLSGDEGRKVFFESKVLNFTEGYGALIGGSPKTEATAMDKPESANEFADYFTKRLNPLLKRGQFQKQLPVLLSDVHTSLQKLADDRTGMTNPFDSIYRIVYQITMRIVACNEIASDPNMLATTLKSFETLEAAVSPTFIMFPSLPTKAKLVRAWEGARLYKIFQNIIDDRKKTGRRETDALQSLMDQGDSTLQIITFVLGALFAGQLNSGINAAWIFVYLATSPTWLSRVRTEILTVANKYTPRNINDSNTNTAPLAQRLHSIPLEAWESEFPTIDLCLRECIRCQSTGAGFRKNTSDNPIPIPGTVNEVIPPGAFVAYHLGDIHFNPSIYPDPSRWDPGRYLPDRAEDQRGKHYYVGWGSGRHPCPGMKFAKLEVTIITAFWAAMFEWENVDGEGKRKVEGEGRPKLKTNWNAHTASKPVEEAWVRFWNRDGEIGGDPTK